MEEAANYLSSFRSIEEMESRGLIEKQTFLQRENAVLLREKFVSIIQS
jgi:hypothetical protein